MFSSSTDSSIKPSVANILPYCVPFQFSNMNITCVVQLLNQSSFTEIFQHDIMFLSSTKECSDTDFAFESELSVGPFSLSQPNPTVKSFKVLVMLMHTACLLIFAKVAMTTYKHFSGQQQLELVLCENMNKTIKNLQKKLSQKDRKIGQDILCLRCLQ